MRSLTLTIFCFALTACGSKGGSDVAAANVSGVSPAAQKEADKTWDTLCVTCHGTTGKGDGAAAASLVPKPRSFADKAWQKQSSDDRIKKVILEGGAAVGLSPLMIPNPTLKGKDEVLTALVKKIRDFDGK